MRYAYTTLSGLFLGMVLGPIHTSQNLAQVRAAARRYGYTVEVLTGGQPKV